MSITINDMSVEEARSRWRYDPETGAFYHNRHYTGKGIRKNGSPAGHLTASGYVVLRASRPKIRGYQAHRVAWLITYGRWPSVEIDHINGVRNDNRLSNLREATVAENNRNNLGYRKGRLKGAYARSNGTWYAAIRHGKKLIYLGGFSTELEAHAAYLAKAAELHGAFFRAPSLTRKDADQNAIIAAIRRI